MSHCSCRGECRRIHDGGQCPNVDGLHGYGSKYPARFVELDGKTYCSGCAFDIKHIRRMDVRFGRAP